MTNMSTTNIDFYLNEIETSKKDIHQAIINKGGTPTGGLSSYADAINNIEIPKLVAGPLDVLYVDNGSYKIDPSEYGFDVFDAVKIDINVPQSGGDSKPQIPNGFKFTGGQMIPGQTIFGLYDWSLVYDLLNFFKKVNFTGFTADDWKDFEQNFNGKIVDANGMFHSCSNLTSIPQLDTSNTINMNNMFNNCTSLTTIPLLDTRNVVVMGSMFNSCISLTTIPQLDTRNVVVMASMFQSCYNLTSIPLLNTSNVTDMNGMFHSCSNLTSIPLLNTSNVTDMNRMFSGCRNLTSIPQLDTSKVTNMSYIFQSCSNLTSIPLLDTSNVTNMSYMFDSINLTTIPQLDTSNATNMNYMFNNCSNLTTIPQLDTSNATNMSYMFYNCRKLNEVRFKGNPQNVTSTSNMFYNTGRDVENPTLYYDSRYDYSKIINILPTNWTAVPYDVEEYETQLQINNIE